MNCTTFTAVLLISCSTLSAYGVFGETCAELKARCLEYQRNETSSVMQISLVGNVESHPVWPVPEAILEESRHLGDAHCRLINNSGPCRTELLTRCPEYHDNRTDGWYMAELVTAFTRICDTTIGAVKFHRAAAHCLWKAETLLRSCCFIGAEGDGAPQKNAAAAHQTFCRMLDEVLERTNGSQGTELAAKCGQDVVDIIKEGHKQMHNAHCST